MRDLHARQQTIAMLDTTTLLGQGTNMHPMRPVRYTVVDHLEGGGTVATTMSRYQHPERVGIVMAVLLPLLYELYRFKRARTKLGS
jgi:hypothetical protein